MSHHRNVVRRAACLSVLPLIVVSVISAPSAAAEDSSKDLASIREKAIAVLKKSQAKDGSFTKVGPGGTALVIAALLKNGVGPDDPAVKKALDSLTSKVQKDGGIYEKKLANYTTCVGIMALNEANKEGKYDKIIKGATAFLKKLQADDPASKELKFGGGVGYDGKGRPDLSNTQFFIDALIAAGVPKDDPAIQRALKFVTRCQNLPDKEKGNDLPFAEKASEDDKGGFTYVPDPDESSHKTADGGLRSLGAMTYAGLKSFLYAGVKKDDPRVQGAIKWIRNHWTLDENPGQGQSGLYYYYHTFAKAMDALGEEEFKDAKGTSHSWRKELLAALKKRQQEDGSFVNKDDRAFGEKDPALATAFALLSLSYCEKK